MPDDINFVYSTWLRSYKHDSPITRYIKSDLFFAHHQKLLDSLLSSEVVRVLIACDSDEPNVIYGWAAYAPRVIHFVYVKEPFRKMNIARKLIEETQAQDNWEASHLTYSLLDLWRDKKVKWAYNPYKQEER